MNSLDILTHNLMRMLKPHFTGEKLRHTTSKRCLVALHLGSVAPESVLLTTALSCLKLPAAKGLSLRSELVGMTMWGGCQFLS